MLPLARVGSEKTNGPRGNAHIDRPRLELAAHDLIRPDDSSLTDPRSTQDGGLAADPDVLADRDGLNMPPSRRRRLSDLMVVITDGDELAEICTGSDLDALVGRERGRVPDKAPIAEHQHAAPVHRERGPVVDLAPLADHEPGARVEEQTASPPDLDIGADGDTGMEASPYLRAETAFAAPAAPRKRVETHRGRHR